MKSLEEICNLFPDLFSFQRGDSSTEVNGVSPQEEPAPQTLVFLSKPEALPKVLQSKASAIVIPEDFVSQIPEDLNFNTLSSKNTRLAMANALSIFYPHRLTEQLDDQIHPSAFIHPSAELGNNVKIGPHVFVGPKAHIGDHSVIGTSAVIQSESKIGSHCLIHEQAYIGARTQMGDHCEIHPQVAIGTEGFGFATDSNGNNVPIPHQGAVVLGKNVHIGAGTKIDRGTFGNTEIGDETKIDNLCHIAHNCIIGKSCFITAGYMSAGSTIIGDKFSCGGRTTVTGHIKITDNVQVAGLSGVQKSIEKPGKYQGFPIMPHKEGLKNMLAYSKLGRIRADLKRALKALGLEETK